MRKANLNKSKVLQTIFTLITLATMLFTSFAAVQPVSAAANLTVRIIAAPNLIVDSNVMSPSTEQPIVATVIGEFCNTSTTTALDNVTGYIGDYTAGTPGIYPLNTPGTISGGGVSTAYDGSYSFTHLGGTADATRYIGTIPANTCKYQYWSFSYPKYAYSGGSKIPAWGNSVKPGDDLFLDFDIWGNYPGQTATSATHKMTLRNEISAMANKIEPNGNPGGQWFNTDTSTVLPGQTIVTNGILYRLGNVNQGFDNDANGVPDYNAWLQPFGNPSYDPSCFRLVETHGTLTVTTTSGDVVIPFQDSLYFTDLPQNNTNVVGEVFYRFLALGGACTIPISPYQEAASGSDNEKFNGDYGAGPSPAGTYAPSVSITKTAPGTISEPGSGATTFTYEIPFANTSTTSAAGLTLTSGGSVVESLLVIEDQVPVGLQYVCSSASATLAGSNTVTITYSNDGGTSWSATQPGGTCPGSNPTSTSANPIRIRWKLNNPVPKSPDAGSTGNKATFQAAIPFNYIAGNNPAFINNCAEGKFGVNSLPFNSNNSASCVTTMVTGSGTIGNRVWLDANSDGIQNTGSTAETTQIGSIGLTLYWDKNGNGQIDSQDLIVATQDSTSGSAVDPDEANTNYNFTGLPDARYLVKINKNDPDLDTGATLGYGLTTTDVVAVTLSSTSGRNYNNADFGFGPVLVVDKHVSTLESTLNEGGLVTFHINLYNKLPGDGTAAGYCKYTVYAGTWPPVGTVPPNEGTGSTKAWLNEANGTGAPDGKYATTNLSNNPDTIGFSGFNIQGLGDVTGVHLVARMVVTKKLQVSTSEYITLNVYRNDNATATDFFTYDGQNHITGGAGTEYIFDNALSGTWAWSDFVGDKTEFSAYGKGAGGVSGDVGLDSVAFVITTNKICAGADSTITELPLTDTYDSTKLQFVSASVTPTDTSTPGTLYWANLGPLYAGGTKELSVTFRALDPGGNSTTTTNTAAVNSSHPARFANGRSTNYDDDDASVTINGLGKISGTVFVDNATTGWQGSTGYSGLGSTDFGVYGATVTLRVCSDGAGIVTTASSNKSCTGLPGGTWGTSALATTTTDANGYYEFPNLSMGYYYVAVSLPAWISGATTSAEAGASETNQNPNGSDPTGHSTTAGGSQWGDLSQNLNETSFNPIGSGSTLASPNENITNVNFGYTTASNYVYGKVYTDVNGDGSQGSGEPNRQGETVKLCTVVDCSSGTVYTTTTAADGTFSFSGVTNTTYYVVVTPPSGTNQTDDPDNSGTCSTCDNRTQPFTIAAGQSLGAYIFGYQPTGDYTIGNLVYRDWDGDGTPDTGEEGIPGITVSLYEDENDDGLITSGTDALIATTSTAPNGAYTFPNRPNGNYIVVVDTADPQFPVNHTQTGDPDASGTCSGSACDSRSTSAAISDADDLDNDFGYKPTGFGTIGDYVWIDANGDGIQGSNESGQSGVTLHLYRDVNGDGVVDTTDAQVQSVTTVGYSVIDGYINIDGDNATPPDSGDNLASLFGIQVISGGLDVNKDGSITTADDGTFGRFTVIDGRLDMNGDGSVTSADDGSLAGFYLFQNVPTSSYNYIVKVDPAELTSGDLKGYAFSSTGTSYNTSAVSYKLGLTDSAQTVYTADFGFATTAIGDFIWADYNGDGIADTNEPGINNVVMQLYTDVNNNGAFDAGTDTLYAATTTANNSLGKPGYYLFSNVPAGNYIVKVADANFTGGGALVGYTLSGDPDVYNTTTPSSVSCLTTGAQGCDGLKPYDRYASSSPYDENPAIRLGSDERTADFGYQPLARIGDTLWIDANGNGLREATEAGIPNVTVRLCSTVDCLSGTPVVTTTDENGHYSFGSMASGTYYVVVTTTGIPTGLTQTYDPVTYNNCNSGTCTTAVQVVVNTARSGGAVQSIGSNTCPVGTNCDLNVDFAWRVYGTNSIGGTVWFDADNGGADINGIGDIDPGETTRYSDVPVYLWYCGTDAICGGVNSADDVMVGTTTTASNGTYSFTNLANGTYKVIVNNNAYNLQGLSATTPTAYTGVTLDGTTPTAQRDFGFLAAMDLGDLPTAYNNTLLVDNGARHTIGTVYLGNVANPSSEGDGKESALASGDDLDDGVKLTPSVSWTVGTEGGSVDITTSASCTASAPCYLSAWVNWNPATDTDFSDSGERILLDKPVYGTQTVKFDIPSGTNFSSQTFYARYRLYSATTNGLAQPTGLSSNGEVEDYKYTFGPNAVTLQSLNAHSSATAPWALATFAALLTLGLAGLVVFKKRA